MPHQSYYRKVGALRAYSGNATPYFFEIPFRGGFTGPVARPRAAEIPVTDRGILTVDAHYVSGADDDLLGPLSVRFDFRLTNTDPNYQKLLDVIRPLSDVSSAVFGGSGATAYKHVGGKPWTTTKGTSQIRNADPNGSSLITTPLFTDDERHCVNIEILWDDPQDVRNKGFRYREVYFRPDQTITEGDTDVMVSMEGECYGGITEISAFTAGNWA